MITDIAEQSGAIHDQSEFSLLTSLGSSCQGSTMRRAVSQPSPTGPLRQLVASAEGYCVPANPTIGGLSFTLPRRRVGLLVKTGHLMLLETPRALAS